MNDSLEVLPFAHIIIVTKNQGTISNFNGFFSFVVEQHDTILFSTMGYKHQLFIFPDTIDKDEQFISVILERDTIMIGEVEVFPYATFEQFKQAFLTIEIPDDELERAKKNIALINIQKMADISYSDASLSYKNYMNQQWNQLYTRGQNPVNNLLNPFAWAKLIKAIKEGDFKKKEEE